MKKLISLLICIVAIYIVTIPKDLGAQALRVLLPVQGGTGISTSSPTDIGKCIKVLSDSPFRYELASCGGLGSDPTIIQVDGTPQSVGTPTLNFTGNSFSLTESPADTFSLRVSTSTLGLLASSISDFVTTARTSISETITGLTYTLGTGVLSIDSGYTIPTTTRETNQDTAFSWGNHALQGYVTATNATSSITNGTTTNLFINSSLIVATSTALFGNMGLYLPTSLNRPNQSETIITTFQSGHSFTNSGGTGTMTDDTTIYTIGTSSLKLQTDAIGSTMYVQKISISPKIDVRNKAIKVVMRIATTSDISLSYPSRFWVAISSDNFNGYRYCEFMPDIYFQPSGGTWMTSTCNLGDLQRSDVIDLSQINAIRIYARATNITSATFWINKISLVPVTKTPIISFSFDDGNSTDYTVAMPKLSQYGFPATTYIIPSGVGTGGYITLNQVKELKENHGWQIASHDNINYTTYTNTSDLEKRILYIKNWFLQNGLSGGIDDFAYPNGAMNTDVVLPIIKKYFRSGRLDDTTGLGKIETIPYGNQYKLHSYMVNANNPVATVKAEIDNAVANNGWIILGFHNLNSSATGPDYTPDNFNQIIDYIYTTYTSQGKANVRTIADVLDNEYQDNFSSIFQYNNNIGIGTSTPYTNLTVAGGFGLTGALYDHTASAGTNGMVLQTTSTGVTWVATSTLGTIATTSLTASGALSLSQPISVVGSSASALTCLTASGSQNGCLSSSDWTSFNGKVSSTSIDTLTELETLMSGINIIASTELDTETEFQNLVGGLNFITTNDTSAITPAMVFNTGLTDEYCLTYETTGSTWEWQTCGTGTVNSGLLGQVARYNANGTAVTGTSSIFIADNTNVGVGTSTPNATLTLSGNATSTGSIFNIFSNYPSSGSVVMNILNTGNVGIGTTTPSSKLTVFGHVGTDGAIPALTSCGTSPAITLGSTDTAGEITEGSGATGCTITFASAYTTTPFCTVTEQSGLAASYTISTSTITITNIGALSNTKINYVCVSND